MITNDNSHEIAKLLKIQKRTHKVSAHQYSSTSQASISDKSTQKKIRKKMKIQRPKRNMFRS